MGMRKVICVGVRGPQDLGAKWDLKKDRKEWGGAEWKIRQRVAEK